MGEVVVVLLLLFLGGIVGFGLGWHANHKWQRKLYGETNRMLHEAVVRMTDLEIENRALRDLWNNGARLPSPGAED